MRLLGIICLGLLISSVAVADSQRVYSGVGSVLERGSDPETEPDGKRTPYLVTLQLNEGGDDGVALLTTSVVREAGDPAIETLRLRKSGTDSFDILDRDNNQIGWGHKVEFEHQTSLKVHGLILNWRTEDDRSVVQYLRFTRENGILFSTGSIIDKNGEMLLSWYEKMQRVYASGQP